MSASFREIIGKWPNLGAFARDIGVTENTAKQMRTRDSVKAEYWGKMVAGARRRRIEGVTLEVLARLKASGARPKSSAARAQAA